MFKQTHLSVQWCSSCCPGGWTPDPECGLKAGEGSYLHLLLGSAPPATVLQLVRVGG